MGSSCLKDSMKFSVLKIGLFENQIFELKITAHIEKKSIKLLI